MQVPRVGAGAPIVRPSTSTASSRPRRDQLVPAIAATIAGTLMFLLNPGLLLATSLLLALVLAAVLLRERQHKPGTVILVGKSPLAAMVAVSLEQQPGRPSPTILRLQIFSGRF